MLTKEQYDELFATTLDKAYAAANAAQAGLVEDMNALDCGFAWVVTHDIKLANWCKRQIKACGGDRRKARRYGAKHHAAGWCFWCPGDFNGQSIGIHEAGAKAFADVIAHSLQIRVERGSRLD